jgi:hypothetical protein
MLLKSCSIWSKETPFWDKEKKNYHAAFSRNTVFIGRKDLELAVKAISAI